MHVCLHVLYVALLALEDICAGINVHETIIGDEIISKSRDVPGFLTDPLSCLD